MTGISISYDIIQYKKDMYTFQSLPISIPLKALLFPKGWVINKWLTGGWNPGFRHSKNFSS